MSLALLITAFVPLAATSQSDRDYIRQDDEGHLILRFVGAGGASLSEEQHDEILNAFVSVMVHDRLRADVDFELESVDAHWADAVQAQLGRHLNAIGDIELAQCQCRSVSCRLVFRHADAWRVADHQSLMDVVQENVERTLETYASLQPEFLIAAYYQERETQYIKVYLSRAR